MVTHPVSERFLYITQVIHALAPESGGPSVTVPALCENLGALGNRVELFATNHGGKPRLSPKHFALRLHKTIPGGGWLGVSLEMHRALVRAASEADIIHSHGLWLWTNFDAYFPTRRGGAKIVLSPRGMLEPYALERRGRIKRALWHAGQGAAVRAADCIHVTSDTELSSVRAMGLRNPIAVIPNGVAIPDVRPRNARAQKRLLFLGRIDHKKGVDLLLQAWASVSEEFPEWLLSIVGPDHAGFRSKMELMKTTLRLNRVEFLPAAYGVDRDRLLADSDLFVLPTRSESFGMTVAEALAAGVPALCTSGAPWSRLASERCGWSVEVGPEPIAAGLRTALAMPESELRAMGARGRDWMQAEFSWQAQAQAMTAVYRWLRGQAPQPPTVESLGPLTR